MLKVYSLPPHTAKNNQQPATATGMDNISIKQKKYKLKIVGDYDTPTIYIMDKPEFEKFVIKDISGHGTPHSKKYYESITYYSNVKAMAKSLGITGRGKTILEVAVREEREGLRILDEGGFMWSASYENAWGKQPIWGSLIIVISEKATERFKGRLTKAEDIKVW